MNRPASLVWLASAGALWACGGTQAHAERYGQYRDEQVGRMVNYPEREVFYDFDGPEVPATAAPGGRVALSGKHYLTPGQSLAWDASPDNALAFDFAPLAIDISRWGHMLRVAILSETDPASGTRPVFRLEVLGGGNVLTSTTLFLHRKGWNCYQDFLSSPDWKKSPQRRVTADGFRLVCLSGSGNFYVDNVGLAIAIKEVGLQAINPGYTQESLPTGFVPAEAGMAIATTMKELNAADHPPSAALTREEERGLREIEQRLERFLGVRPVKSLPDSRLESLRDRYLALGIERSENGINGQDLTEWAKGTPGSGAWTTRMSPSQAAHYEACTLVGELGRAYASTSDADQKRALGSMLADIVAVAEKLGTAPSSWYPGRGFVPGAYLARDHLREVGLAEKISRHVRVRYETDVRLYSTHDEHLWPLYAKHHGLSWTNADYLNTSLRSMLISILLQQDSPEKARDLYRFSSHFSRHITQPAPGTYGAWKPDGSTFHHWGHRYDGYGWQGAWLGTTQSLFFLSRTPFRAPTEVHETVRGYAKTRYFAMTPGGTLGPAFNSHPDKSVRGYAYLAEAGTADGTRGFDREMASFGLAAKAVTGGRDAWVDDLEGKADAAPPPRGNQMLSYAGQMQHRRSDWVLYFHGTSSNHYVRQYVTPGVLFHSIGAMTAFHADGKPHPATLAGYDARYAPGSTSMRAPAEKLDSPYYFRGLSPMVGGVSTESGNGVFAIEFAGQQDAKHKKTTLGDLGSTDFGFRKSFFCFENVVVSLGAGIDGDLDLPVDTALMQSPLGEDRETLWVNGAPVTEQDYEERWADSPALYVASPQRATGVYIPAGQAVTLRKGSQTWVHDTQDGPREKLVFPSASGRFARVQIEHGVNPEQAAYRYFTLIEPAQGELARFAERMGGQAPPFKIVMNTPEAQVVLNDDTSSLGLVAFEPFASLPEESVISAVGAPCVAVAETRDDGRLVLSVSVPDLKFSKNKFGKDWWAQPTALTLDLRGSWRLAEESGSDGPHVEAGNRKTQVRVTCRDGLTRRLVLTPHPRH